MKHYKTHYQVNQYGSPDALKAWAREGLTPNKVKFCDGLMLSKSREHDFTKDTEGVDCKKCQKKMHTWAVNGFVPPD